MTRLEVYLSFSVDQLQFTRPSPPLPQAFKNFKILAKTTKKLLTTHELLKRQQQVFKVYTELVN